MAETGGYRADFTALLEHLTGPARGVVVWLSAPDLVVAIGADRRPVVGPAAAADARAVARLTAVEDGHDIEALNGHSIWINRRLVQAARLRDGDVIEFDEIGPISRYRCFDGKHPLRWTVNEMAGDSLAYLRASRKPLGRRLGVAAGSFTHRLLWQTTLVFRLTVLIALVALGAFAVQQYRTAERLAASIEAGAHRLDDVATALADARAEALRPADLGALREELAARMTTNVARLDALERVSGAARRVIAEALPAVALLQGAYGLREIESGRMLRHVVGPGGTPLITPQGKPFLSLTGDGPVAEVQFTGTGFLLAGGGGLMVTNRHVALPWEKRAGGGQAPPGMEPVRLRFIAYFPDRPAAHEAELAFASDAADLAVVRLSDPPEGVAGLALAEAPPLAGETVVVMGYPTGLRSLLAQSGPAFVKALEEDRDTDFWSVAERLAEAGLIMPLASRGIVGQVAAEALVYDAETTHGGSGGPVLNAEGRVVAVNAAILPEFGGSNLGVPVEKLRALLADNAGAVE